MKKRVLSLFICIAMIFAMLGVLNSCAHKHKYDSAVTEPNCVREGYTTYTCKCGDSYIGDVVAIAHELETVAAVTPTCEAAGNAEYVKCKKCSYTTYVEIPANGHDFETEITKYPTMSENGHRKLHCLVCDGRFEEDIDAVSMSLPTASDVLSAIIGSAAYSIDAGNSTIIYKTETENENYADMFDESYSVEIRVAEAELSAVEGVTVGKLIVEVVFTNELEDETKLLSLELYLNGDGVSVAYSMNDAANELEINLTETILDAIGSQYGISHEQMLEIAYVAREAFDMLPSILEAIEKIETPTLPELDADFVENAGEFFDAFGESFLGHTVTDEGYDKYVINVDAFKQFAKTIEGKTVSTVIDELYGAGSADAVREFVVGIPSLTVGEVADAAIELAESYGIDVDKVYFVVNYFISKSAGEDFKIHEEINSRYDMTVAALVAELTGSDDPDEMATMLTEKITETVDMVLALNIEETLNQAFGMTAEEGIIELFESYVDMFKGAVAFEIVLDGDKLAGIAVGISDTASLSIKKTADKSYALSLEIIDSVKISATLTDKGAEIVIAPKDDKVGTLNVVYNASDDKTEKTVDVDFYLDEDRMLDVNLAIKNGSLDSFEFTNWFYTNYSSTEHILKDTEIKVTSVDTAEGKNYSFSITSYAYDFVNGSPVQSVNVSAGATVIVKKTEGGKTFETVFEKDGEKLFGAQISYGIAFDSDNIPTYMSFGIAAFNFEGDDKNDLFSVEYKYENETIVMDALIGSDVIGGTDDGGDTTINITFGKNGFSYKIESSIFAFDMEFGFAEDGTVTLKGDLVADGDDMLDLDVSVAKDGAMNVLFVMRDAVRYGSEPDDVAMEELFYTSVTSSKDGDKISYSALCRQEGDVVLDLDYSVTEIETEAGKTIEIAYDIDRFLIDKVKHGTAIFDDDLDLGIINPDIPVSGDYSAFYTYTYIAGEGKITFTLAK